MIKFDAGDICNFTVNGRLQKHIKHKDNIQVRINTPVLPMSIKVLLKVVKLLMCIMKHF